MTEYLKIKSYRKINPRTDENGKPIPTKNVGWYAIRLTPEFEFVINPINFKRAYHEKNGKSYLVISDISDKVFENRFRAERLLKPAPTDRAGKTVLIGGNWKEFIPLDDLEKSYESFEKPLTEAEPEKKSKKRKTKEKPEPQPKQEIQEDEPEDEPEDEIDDNEINTDLP